MIEYIGLQVKEKLSSLDWITHPGGYAFLVNDVDGSERVAYPATKEIKNGVWTGKYDSMLPDSEKTCLAFVDSQNDITVELERSRYRVLVIPFRVVVWLDETKLEVQGNLPTIDTVFNAIKSAVCDADFPEFQNCRTTFQSITFDPARIWAGYTLRPDDALFLAPYRTFAITFRLRAYEMTCATSQIESNEICC